IILYGTLKNARQTDAKGNGTVELHVHEVLKGHPITAGKKVVILDQYVHLANIDGPPRFTVFCSVHENKIETYRSIHVTAPGIVNYVQGALALDPKDHAKALAFFFAYLDHASEDVRTDAYLEFVRSGLADWRRAAKHFDADRIEDLLQRPETPARA